MTSRLPLYLTTEQTSANRTDGAQSRSKNDQRLSSARDSAGDRTLSNAGTCAFVSGGITAATVRRASLGRLGFRSMTKPRPLRGDLVSNLERRARGRARDSQTGRDVSLPPTIGPLLPRFVSFVAVSRAYLPAPTQLSYCLSQVRWMQGKGSSYRLKQRPWHPLYVLRQTFFAAAAGSAEERSATPARLASATVEMIDFRMVSSPPVKVSCGICQTAAIGA
jgi:hypothetical protein